VNEQPTPTSLSLLFLSAQLSLSLSLTSSRLNSGDAALVFFQAQSSAKAALSLTGAMVAGSAIRVHPLSEATLDNLEREFLVVEGSEAWKSRLPVLRGKTGRGSPGEAKEPHGGEDEEGDKKTADKERDDVGLQSHPADETEHQPVKVRARDSVSDHRSLMALGGGSAVQQREGDAGA